MSNRYVMESLLRPAVELYSAAAGGAATFVLVVAPWSMALAPQVSYVTAAGFAVFTTIRTRQGLRILRYRRNIRRLPRYQMSSESIPVSRHFLFLGKGFMWEQKHTQRLLETKRPEVAPFLKPSIFYSLARQFERRYEYTFPGVCSLTRRDSPLNPVRPLPPVGGNSAIHGVEMEEDNVLMSLTERVGHLLVLGTTRVGKTRLAELLITQDIRRGNVTIVFDPKGDADLLKRMWAEAKRAGRSDEFYIFHLGWPDISARYNAVGRFGRVSEVASRVAGQLGGDGSNAAFKEFAWRFVNIIARALVVLGLRPDYSLILRYVTNIAELYETYAEKLLTQRAPALWLMVQNQMGILTEDDLPRTMQGQVNAIRVMAIEVALSSDEGKKIYDPVLDGLRSAVRYDRTYFDKIVASLLPLLEKLTTGKTAALLSPDYSDMNDPRPLMDWQEIIRKGGVVYVGLDALSDSEVASAVGNSMFADLVSTAGYIYKFGLSDDMPEGSSQRLPISLHCDEFNELMGEEFIPMINKGGGAGIEVTAYTQTWSDIEAKIGNAAKAAQVTGNFNNLIMLRVREKTTAELLTTQLPEVEIYTKTLVSGVTDISNPDQGSDFTSNVQDRVSSTRVPLLSPAEVMNLPKGQAFALLEGGRLWKVRMPLPASVDDEMMPKNLQSIVTTMRKNYRTGDTWWSGSALPGDNQVDAR
ncbi:TPA: type IV conjugative transfer system coupling protein TraD [Salmonella enterica]|nr:type IV conjugative transfer system coupling protein TraD [Salmonella enterica]EBM0610269.1 conjugative coupling factor TraD, PFGI-1 class [Salmonella enterica]EJX6160085.1 type IV conjugative transfer system coupling protein TraD [Salmonella enterica]EJX9789409.1 type IV conjugative transfer system coupling protein TraD [Salmonella enterica]ELH0603435.1 type IV conjugative transfer system coupling protein TraD [Salmonella enterica]